MKGGHTLSVWASIVMSVVVAMIGALALVAHGGVCNEPSSEYPFFSFFCEVRRTGLSAFLVTAWLLIIVLLYAASYDRDDADPRNQSRRAGAGRLYHRPAKGVRAIWNNKETPHRRKTMGVIFAIVVLAATWFIIIEYVPIALPPMFPDSQ